MKFPALELLEGLEEDGDESLDVDSSLLSSSDHLTVLSVGESDSDGLRRGVRWG